MVTWERGNSRKQKKNNYSIWSPSMRITVYWVQKENFRQPSRSCRALPHYVGGRLNRKDQWAWRPVSKGTSEVAARDQGLRTRWEDADFTKESWLYQRKMLPGPGQSQPYRFPYPSIYYTHPNPQQELQEGKGGKKKLWSGLSFFYANGIKLKLNMKKKTIRHSFWGDNILKIMTFKIEIILMSISFQNVKCNRKEYHPLSLCVCIFLKRKRKLQSYWIKGPPYSSSLSS